MDHTKVGFTNDYTYYTLMTLCYNSKCTLWVRQWS